MAPKGTRTRKLSDEEIAQAEEERKSAPVEDVTTFEEDDDPRQFVGETVADGPEDDD